MPKSPPFSLTFARFGLLFWLLAGAGSADFWWFDGRPVPIDDAAVTAIPCLSYAPFRGFESAADPDLVIPPERIDEDLVLLSKITPCVRTYTVSQGLGYVPEAAKRLDMTVLLGAWIGDETDRNDPEMSQALAIANRYPQTVKMVIVGNETLLRKDIDAETLRGFLQRARAQTDVAIGYADVWERWLENPELSEDVDVVVAHILPYWEDDPVGVDDAITHFRTVWAKLTGTFPDTPIYIGETGWPSAGRMRGPAEPGRLNQARFVRDVLSVADAEGMPVNVVEAFDQRWKMVFEGAAGGSWGIYGEDRERKVPLNGAVSNSPDWAVHWAASLFLALLAMIVLTNNRRPPKRRSQIVTAIATHAGGVTLVLAAIYIVDSSRGAAAWLFGGGVWTAAAASALLAGLLLFDPSHRSVPSLSAVFSRLRKRQFRVFATRRGAFAALRVFFLILVFLTTALLVVDGRYRGFPVALYLLPAVSIALVTWARDDARGTGDKRERALSLASLVAVLALIVSEGLANHQAIAWSVVALLLTASGPAITAFRRHRRRRDRGTP